MLDVTPKVFLLLLTLGASFLFVWSPKKSPERIWLGIGGVLFAGWFWFVVLR